MTPDFVVAGNLLVDDLVFPDGRTRMGQPGGAVLYATLAAALWGARAGAASLRGEDYPAAALEALSGRAVALDGVHELGRTGVRTWLLYEGRVRRVVHRLGCPSHEQVSPLPDALPPDWRAVRAFHLAPMPLAVQREWVAMLAVPRPGAEAFVSVDPHRPITEETLEEWRQVLAGVDAFFPSEDELLLEQAAHDPRAALRRLACGRLRFIAFKRGAQGGLLFDAHEDRFHAWPAHADRVVDPTGAGDAFAAGFVTAHLDGRPVGDSLARAVATASFAIEDWGADGLLAATRADAEARVRDGFGEQVRT
jgi:sugar/nucleoside kinase (ribokinase family)